MHRGKPTGEVSLGRKWPGDRWQGELVIVFVETQEETRNTHVEVISKKVTSPGPFESAERNWAVEILNQLDKRLKHSSGH